MTGRTASATPPPFEQPVLRWTQRISGVVLLLFGTLVSAFTGWLVWRCLLQPRPVRLIPEVVVLMLGAASLGVFTTSLGIRLLWRRPTSYGSLMTPGGWGALGFVFVGFVVVVLGAPPDHRPPVFAIGLWSAALLACACFAVGWRLRGRHRR